MTEKANNVILFPGVKSVFAEAPPSLQEIREKNIELIVEQMQDSFGQILQKHNVKMRITPEFMRDTEFLKQAVRGATRRAMGMPHMFQNIADLMFITTEEPDGITVQSVPLSVHRLPMPAGSQV